MYICHITFTVMNIFLEQCTLLWYSILISVLLDNIGKETFIKGSYTLGTGEIAQQAKALAVKTNNLSSILGTQIVEE